MVSLVVAPIDEVEDAASDEEASSLDAVEPEEHCEVETGGWEDEDSVDPAGAQPAKPKDVRATMMESLSASMMILQSMAVTGISFLNMANFAYI